MNLAERIGLPIMRRIDPEHAHGLALRALRAGLGPSGGPVRDPRLATRLAGIALENPLGLAAGFDKNAEALGPLSRAGFGFLEVGAATPRPQPGNPRPRLFRLSEDRAAINRFGFNNDGAAVIADRLAARAPGVPVGLNLGANKDSADRAADFAQVLRIAGPHVDFATVNVSSPNTERLRDLQAKDALTALLDRVRAANEDLARPVPVFLKIAPDLDERALADIAEVAMAAGLDGMISQAARCRLSAWGGSPRRMTPMQRSARAPRPYNSIPRSSTAGCRLSPRSFGGCRGGSNGTASPISATRWERTGRHGCDRHDLA